MKNSLTGGQITGTLAFHIPIHSISLYVRDLIE